jgi:hypothetical protein
VATQMHNVATVLSTLRGVSFIGLDIETVVPLKGGKKNEMQGRVTKRVTGSTVLVAQNKNTNTYQNMVRNAIVGELLASYTDKLAKAQDAQTLLEDVLGDAELAKLASLIEVSLAETNEDRREEAEDRFQVQARKWGNRIPNTPFIQHTKKGETEPSYYLDTVFLRAGRVEFFLDGQPIDEDKIIGYEKTEVKEGANVQGGLKAENQIIVRSIGLASVLAIRTAGKQYAGSFYYA